MKKIWNLVTTTVLIILLLVVAAMYLPKFVGIQPMIVLSGSMEPTYPTGSLLYIKEVDPENLKVGDAITFVIGEDTVVTHRIIAQDTVAKTFTTQGDANEVADGTPVSYENIIGAPCFHIPELGHLAEKLDSTSGKIIYATAVVVVLILMYMGDMIWPNKEEKKDEDLKDNQ